MAQRSLNKVMLIGNVVKDPELRYTPQGTAVCTFTVAVNREWKDSTGQKKTEATFIRAIAWSKLAEIISQYMIKGGKVYVEGRLSNRTWKDKQGIDHYMTEIVTDELILLDNKKGTRQQTTTINENIETPPEPEPTLQPEEIEKPDKLNIDEIPL